MVHITDYFEKLEYAAALPIVDKKENKRRIIGTATMVMPGIFFTARHLIQQYMKDHDALDYRDDDWLGTQYITSTYSLDLLHVLKNREVITWSVQQIHPMQESDLAILTAVRVEDTGKVMEKLGMNMCSLIDLHMPGVSTTVTSLGYPNSDNVDGNDQQFATLDNNQRTTHIVKLKKCEGQIEDIDERVTQRSPRFQTNLTVDGGMSGGPVYNARGALTGINSTGIPPNEYSNTYTSFATPLFTAFHTPLTIVTESEGETKQSLFQLAQKGYLQVRGLEHFRDETGHGVWDSKTIRCSDCP